MQATSTLHATSEDVELWQVEENFAVVADADEAERADNEEPSDDEEHASARLLKNDGPSEPTSTAKAAITDEDDDSESAIDKGKLTDEKPVTWKSLPKKSQLAILTLARLSEPLTQTSLSAYMFYQLRSFDTSLPDSTIAAQGGMMQASFPAAQFITAVLWGQAADTPWMGRKRVLLIGLLGTCFSCVGFGFSKSFTQAMLFRVVGGAVNGNMGVMRTMISEIIEEKKYQSRAFLILPMCFNIGVIIGPILGGFLADPVHSFPNVFGPESIFGGEHGVWWMTHWPYALPNLVSAFFILISALCVIFGLDETHIAMRNKPDLGRRIGKWASRLCSRNKDSHLYSRLDQPRDYADETNAIDLEEHPRQHAPSTSNTTHNTSTPPITTKLPFRLIWTSNVIRTISAHFLLALHISAFNALIFLLLPAPRSANTHARLPFRFTGGLGLPSAQVGLATAVIGLIGFPLQLLLYPRLNTQLGTLKCYRLFLPFSPLAYTLLPFLALLPNTPALVWPALIAVLGCQVLARTFTLPGAIILINNSAPHPSVLGTIHGISQSVSSGARTLGPIMGGWLLGLGLKGNCVGAVWWGMAGVAVANWGLLWWLREGP